MPLCGFNKKMIRGITVFAEGLFEATLTRASEEKLDLRVAFDRELKDIGAFLEALETKHQELKHRYPVKAAMRRVASWVEDQDVRGERTVVKKRRGPKRARAKE